MRGQPDPNKLKELNEAAEKLDEVSQHKKLRSLHKCLGRAKSRIEELSDDEDKEKLAKNQPLIEELGKKVVQLREEIKKTLTSSDREKRKQLKRIQRRARKMQVLPLEERQKRADRQRGFVEKTLSAMTKSMKKSQGSPFVHSLRKKLKSLNKRLKKFARIQKKLDASKPAEGEKKT